MKTNEELLLTYKKCNKERRAKIVAQSGLKTEAAYLASLLDGDTKGSTAAGKLFKRNEPTSVAEGTLDMVIAFDTTGSMSSYIGAVRKHIKELVAKLFSDNKNLRLKIVAFGDYCDMLKDGTFGPAYQQTSLTDNQNELIKFVDNAQNTAGGDGDEFYELVIKKITEETPWRPEAKKAVLLIADCGPHEVGYSYGGRKYSIDWKEEAKKSAALGIQWDTLACITSYVNSFYSPLSTMTNGICIPFKSSEKTQEVMYAAASVRGSSASKESFTESYSLACESGDDELIGTYKSLSKLL